MYTYFAYTREKSKMYKSLGVVYGHVQDVMFYDYTIKDVMMLKAEVLFKQMPHI